MKKLPPHLKGLELREMEIVRRNVKICPHAHVHCVHDRKETVLLAAVISRNFFFQLKTAFFFQLKTALPKGAVVRVVDGPIFIRPFSYEQAQIWRRGIR